MSVSQREVYMLPFPLSSGGEDHPFIVLSCKEANDLENTFIAVMITSSTYKDDHSFDLRDEMFEKPLAKQGCHARMHLITLVEVADINGRMVNKMRPLYFKNLMADIGQIIFNYEFVPNP